MTGDEIKVGIDVGGTFTHAVAVDGASLELLAKAVVKTTHRSELGVAAGVVEVLQKLLRDAELDASRIALIAHSTTQATNALLEGDVEQVGIVGMGSGLSGRLAKRQANVSGIELSPGKRLDTSFRWLDTKSPLERSRIEHALRELIAEGARVIVASEAFGVDHPENELFVVEVARELGLAASSASALSKLYGLRIRTRTAVINACMLPRMLETAAHIERALQESGIGAPLMVMRSDGGIMDVAAMRERPILTMLSGPAAGVAAALMHARITDGIFVEVGGTSSDICAIRRGRPIVTNAELGGHKLYVRTLDVRTVGIGGGSVPRVRGKRVHAVGPRSAHIAKLAYDAFSEPGVELVPSTRAPLDGDPDDYLVLKPASGGSERTLTPTGSANLLGLAKSYGKGDAKSVEEAFAAVAAWSGQTPRGVAEDILDACADKVGSVVDDLRRQHDLMHEHCVVVGGGGGAEAVVPYTAQKLGARSEIAPDAEVISAIGVALGLIQECVERTAVDPGEAELAQVRREAHEAVLRMGAAPDSIEVTLEVDRQAKLVRATAQGTPELRTRELARVQASDEDVLRGVRQALPPNVEGLSEVGRTAWMRVYQGERTKRGLLGIWNSTRRPAAVVDGEGVVRFVLAHASVDAVAASQAESRLRQRVQELARFGDGGETLPEVLLVGPRKVADLSGLADEEQVLAALRFELQELTADEPVALISAPRE